MYTLYRVAFFLFLLYKPSLASTTHDLEKTQPILSKPSITDFAVSFFKDYQGDERIQVLYGHILTAKRIQVLSTPLFQSAWMQLETPERWDFLLGLASEERNILKATLVEPAHLRSYCDYLERQIDSSQKGVVISKLIELSNRLPNDGKRHIWGHMLTLIRGPYVSQLNEKEIAENFKLFARVGWSPVNLPFITSSLMSLGCKLLLENLLDKRYEKVFGTFWPALTNLQEVESLEPIGHIFQKLTQIIQASKDKISFESGDFQKNLHRHRYLTFLQEYFIYAGELVEHNLQHNLSDHEKRLSFRRIRALFEDITIITESLGIETSH